MGGADLLQVGDAEDEADGVEDVGLAGAVEAGDGVEVGVEAGHHRPRRVRLESLQTHLLHEHLDRVPRALVDRSFGNPSNGGFGGGGETRV